MSPKHATQRKKDVGGCHKKDNVFLNLFRMLKEEAVHFIGSYNLAATPKHHIQRLKMELDLQSLFGLHVHSCTVGYSDYDVF
jgi:hypothetical protein